MFKEGTNQKFTDFGAYFTMHQKLPASKIWKQPTKAIFIRKQKIINRDWSFAIPLKKTTQLKGTIPKFQCTDKSQQLYKKRQRRINSISDSNFSQNNHSSLKQQEPVLIRSQLGINRSQNCSYDNISFIESEQLYDSPIKHQCVCHNYRYQTLKWENKLTQICSKNFDEQAQFECSQKAFQFLIKTLKPFSGILEKIQQIWSKTQNQVKIEEQVCNQDLVHYKDALEISQIEIKKFLQQTSQMESKIHQQTELIRGKDQLIKMLRDDYRQLSQTTAHKLKVLTYLLRSLNDKGVPIAEIFRQEMPDETKVTIEEILGEKKSVFLRSLAQKLKLSMGNSSEPFNLKLRARLHED